MTAGEKSDGKEIARAQKALFIFKCLIKEDSKGSRLVFAGFKNCMSPCKEKNEDFMFVCLLRATMSTVDKKKRREGKRARTCAGRSLT